MEPFPSLVAQYLFLGVFLIWCLSLLIERVVIWHRHLPKSTLITDRGTYLIINAIVIISIILTISLGIQTILLLDPSIFYIGIIVLILGIITRELAVYTLGAAFNFRIHVSDTQQLIDHGLYRYIRHPAYLGLLLELVGISFCMRSLIGIVLVIFLCGIGIGLRIKYEEEAMLAMFGDKYRAYQTRTQKLIPRLY